MVTVSIKDEYVEVLSALGDLQAAMDLAIQRYTIEQILTKVAELRQRNSQYQAKYGMDYLAFYQRVSEDEVFIENLELKINNLWEIDFADWEFCYKGIGDWTRKLQNILLETNKLLDA
ncbi:hypothetical protein QUA35_03820 [Microcoleus sp. N9_B2]|uniref:hypothetical protein n=1 Tax=unclassified Microcoleus TaxID=2642155 RepID=UPI002FD728A9